MGYNLHITRESPNQISLEEWRQYVNNDVEFISYDENESSSDIEVETNGDKIGDENEVYWKSKDDEIYFSYMEEYGIDVKNPDDEIILKMLSIAKHFDAILEGDDGEEYNDLYFKDRIAWEKQQFPEKYRANKTQQPENIKLNTKPWWKFW